jgi:hypothetical protein
VEDAETVSGEALPLTTFRFYFSASARATILPRRPSLLHQVHLSAAQRKSVTLPRPFLLMSCKMLHSLPSKANAKLCIDRPPYLPKKAALLDAHFFRENLSFYV